MDNFNQNSGLQGLGAVNGTVSEGLSGLGNVNTNNASATIDNSNFGQKFDTDANLFAMDANKFGSIESYTEYLNNFLVNTGVLTVQPMNDQAKQQLGLNNMLCVNFLQNDATAQIEYVAVIATPTINEVTQAIQAIQQCPQANIPVKKVAIGYFNYDNNLKGQAAKVGMELCGYQDLIDLNNAIQSGYNKMPYMNLNGSMFEHRLAKLLNAKYKGQNGQSFGHNFGQQMSGLGAGLGAAFSEGFGQLKSSLFGLKDQFGQAKAQMQKGQQPQQMMNQPVNAVNQENYNSNMTQFANTPMDNIQQNIVSLDKVPESTVETAGVSLEKPTE